MFKSKSHAEHVISRAALIAAKTRIAEVEVMLKAASAASVNFISIEHPAITGKRPITVAARLCGKNFVEVATAHCHPDDVFDHATGMDLAMKRLLGGQSIRLWVPAGVSPEQFVIDTFK